MKRIIDKQTKLFLRDDFEFNVENEIGLDCDPSSGFYLPKWNGTEWIEGSTAEAIKATKTMINDTFVAETAKKSKLNKLTTKGLFKGLKALLRL